MPNPIDIHVGNRLRTIRQIQGLSQEEVGNFIGVSFQQIQKYETGTNRIGASNLYTFAQSLNISVQNFFDGLGENNPDELLTEASKNNLMVLRYFSSLNKKRKRLILMLLRVLAND